MPDPAPVSAVPRRMRLVCALVAAVIVAIGLAVALSLKSNSTGVIEFGAADQVAVAGLALLLGAGVLFLGRSRVDADADGIRFRNIVLTHELPWDAVRSVAFDRKSSWATLRLRSDDEIALFAVQAADREGAVRAVEGLRALLAAAEARRPAPPPLLYPDTRE
jgi:Bacterial PH domain